MVTEQFLIIRVRNTTGNVTGHVTGLLAIVDKAVFHRRCGASRERYFKNRNVALPHAQPPACRDL